MKTQETQETQETQTSQTKGKILPSLVTPNRKVTVLFEPSTGKQHLRIALTEYLFFNKRRNFIKDYLWQKGWPWVVFDNTRSRWSWWFKRTYYFDITLPSDVDPDDILYLDKWLAGKTS